MVNDKKLTMIFNLNFVETKMEKLINILRQAKKEGYNNVNDGSDDLLINDVIADVDSSDDDCNYVADQNGDIIQIYTLDNNGYRASVVSYEISKA